MGTKYATNITKDLRCKIKIFMNTYLFSFRLWNDTNLLKTYTIKQ